MLLRRNYVAGDRIRIESAFHTSNSRRNRASFMYVMRCYACVVCIAIDANSYMHAHTPHSVHTFEIIFTIFILLCAHLRVPFQPNQTRLKVSINSLMDVREFRRHHNAKSARYMLSGLRTRHSPAGAREKPNPITDYRPKWMRGCQRERSWSKRIRVDIDSNDRCQFLIESRVSTKWNVHINLSSMMVRWVAR